MCSELVMCGVLCCCSWQARCREPPASAHHISCRQPAAGLQRAFPDASHSGGPAKAQFRAGARQQQGGGGGWDAGGWDGGQHGGRLGGRQEEEGRSASRAERQEEAQAEDVQQVPRKWRLPWGRMSQRLSREREDRTLPALPVNARPAPFHVCAIALECNCSATTPSATPGPCKMT